MVVATSSQGLRKQPGLHHHPGKDPMAGNAVGSPPAASGPTSSPSFPSAFFGALDMDVDEELLLDVPPPPGRSTIRKPISPLNSSRRMAQHSQSNPQPHPPAEARAQGWWAGRIGGPTVNATTTSNSDTAMFTAASLSSSSSSSRGRGLKAKGAKIGFGDTDGDSDIDCHIGVGGAGEGVVGTVDSESRVVSSGWVDKTDGDLKVNNNKPVSSSESPTIRPSRAKEKPLASSVPPSPDTTTKQNQKKTKKKKASRIESFHHAILINMKETERIRRSGSFRLLQSNPHKTNAHGQSTSSSVRNSRTNNSSTTAELFTETMQDISSAATSTMQTLKSAIQHANNLQQQQRQERQPQQQNHEPQRRRTKPPASAFVGTPRHSSSDAPPSSADGGGITDDETSRLHDFDSGHDITDKACRTNCKGEGSDDSIDVEPIHTTAYKAAKGTQILSTQSAKSGQSHDQRRSGLYNNSQKTTSSKKTTSTTAAPHSASDSTTASVLPSELSHLMAKWCGLPTESNDRSNKTNISNNHWPVLEHPHVMKTMHEAVLKVVTNVDGQLQQSFGNMTNTETETSERNNIHTRDVWAKLAAATGAPTEVRATNGHSNNASVSNHVEGHLYWAFVNAFHGHRANNDDEEDDERTVGTLDTWQDENSQLRRLGSWGTVGSNLTSGTGGTYGTYDTAGTGVTGSGGISTTKNKSAADTSSILTSSEEEEIGRLVLQDDAGHAINPVLLEKAQKSRDRRLSAAAAAAAAASAAASSSDNVDTNTAKRKSKKKRRKRVVKFDYPPIKSLRQYIRPNPEDLPNLFFTEHELDQIEEDRFSTMSTDDIEIVAVSSKLSSSQDEYETTDVACTANNNTKSYVSSVAEKRDSPSPTRHDAVDPPADVATQGLRSVRGRNGTPHRRRPSEVTSGSDEHENSKQQKSPLGDADKASRRGSGRLVKGVQIYLRERSTGA